MTELKPLHWQPKPGIGYTVSRRADGGMTLTFTDLSEATLADWREFAYEHLLGSDRLTRNLYDLRAVREIPERAIKLAMEVNSDPATRNPRVAVLVADGSVRERHSQNCGGREAAARPSASSPARNRPKLAGPPDGADCVNALQIGPKSFTGRAHLRHGHSQRHPGFVFGGRPVDAGTGGGSRARPGRRFLEASADILDVGGGIHRSRAQTVSAEEEARGACCRSLLRWRRPSPKRSFP